METTGLHLPLSSHRTIKRALTLIENHLREPGVAFTSASLTRDWLRLNLAGLEREVFMVMFLDNQNRLLAHETLFHGSITSTEIHPREVVKAALRQSLPTTIHPDMPSPAMPTGVSPSG